MPDSSVFENPLTKIENKIVVDGIEFYDESIFSCKTKATLYENATVGNCYSSEINLVCNFGEHNPSRMAKMDLFIRGELSGLQSEWIPKGTFFIDTRKKNKVSNRMTLHGYDAMLKAEQQYIPTDSESTSWPRKMPAVVADICYRMGVELDERSVINDWDVEYPGDFTMREILGYIAACHVGNFVITDAGALRLVPLVPTGEAIETNKRATSLKDSPAFEEFSKVQFYYDGKDTFSAGDDSGRVLEIESTWVTQEIADAALNAVKGYSYQPYEATGVRLLPTAEIGDLVKIDETVGVIATASITFGPELVFEISASTDEEVDHEYGIENKQARQTRREVAKATAAIRVGVDEIEAKVDGMEGNVSSVSQKVDSIKMEVKQSAGADGQTYASITLKVGDQMYTGQILLDGNVNVSGQLSADALYAALGNIADLTVDKFSTSRRIKKYLAGDTSDDNHIQAQDEELLFVSGVYAGAYEQATSPSGGPLYWESDPDADGVVLGADGYPYKDGVRIFTTTAETDWPVYVFTYEEQVKASFAFEMYGDIYTPVLTMGAGNKDGLNKGVITKSADGLEIIYKANTGADIGMRCGNDGFTDIFGMRKTTGMNFSEFDKGRFYERISGKADRYVYSVAFDAQGNPVLITDPDGNECTITW